MTKLITLFLLITTFASAFEFFPHSQTRVLTNEEITDRTPNFLRYARNEIFARHGYTFSDPDLQLYFQNQKWYKENGKQISLSDIEQQNVELLLAEEKVANSMWLQKTYIREFNHGVVCCVAQAEPAQITRSTEPHY